MTQPDEIVQAECVQCYYDVIGDIKKVVIRELSTKKTKTVTPRELSIAIQTNKIKVRGIGVKKDGTLLDTRRPYNKRPISKEKKELLSLIKRIKKLKSTIPSNDDEKRRLQTLQIKAQEKLEELLRDDSYLKAYQILERQNKTEKD